MKADNTTAASHRLMTKKSGYGRGRIVRDRVLWKLWEKGSKVIVKDKGARIERIFFSARTGISSAEQTGWIVGRTLVPELFLLALPRTFCAMRRDENPFSSERIQATVRMFCGIEIHKEKFLTMGQLQLLFKRIP
jgi:hypothetical protein